LTADGRPQPDSSCGLKEPALSRIRDVLHRHPKVQKAVLFGSRAKGSHKPGSDLDIALVGHELRLKDLNAISLDLDDLLLPYAIDLAIYDRINDPDLLEHINRVGRTIYTRTAG
jgi:predicted nucleotidyltransferase